MADREARHVSLGLQVPERLVRLAQAREDEVERTAFVIDDAVTPAPGVDSLGRMADLIRERSAAVMDPETLARVMVASGGRHLDDATDQTAGRADASVADLDRLVLGAAGAALEVGDIHDAGGRITQAIDRERLAALDLQARLQRKQHEERRDICRGQIVAAVHILDEARHRQVAPQPHEVERFERRMVVADPAMLRDEAVNRRGDAPDNGVTLRHRAILQPSDDARDIRSGSVAKLASDERAVGIAGTRATDGL